MRSRRAFLLAATFAGTLSIPVVRAQTYPVKPVRIVVAFSAGTTSDILARMFGVRLTESLKQQIVVDNRASASGVIAGELTAKALPDGYTLFMAYHQHTVNAALNPKLPYHAVNDFTPISQLTRAGLLLVINPSSPPKNLKDLVAFSNTRAGGLNAAVPGAATALTGGLFKLVTNARMTLVPYKGGAPASLALVAGEVDVGFMDIPSVASHISNGKVNALAVTTERRVRMIPNVPTVTEAGMPVDWKTK